MSKVIVDNKNLIKFIFLQNQNGKKLSDCYYSMTFFINRTLKIDQF